MPTFAFQARDGKGAQVEGTRDASDKNEALNALREAGFFVTRLAPIAASKSAGNAKKINAPTANAAAATAPLKPGAAQGATTRAVTSATPIEYSNESSRSGEDAFAAARQESGNVAPSAVVPVPPMSGSDLWAFANAKELSLFFRQIYSMIDSGTSVSRALKVYSEHANNRGLKRAALQMSRETGEGRTFSEAMRPYPGLFSILAISMIGAGERGGFLDKMCLRLADYCERDFELAQTIKRETLYPKILLICTILIPSVVILFQQGFWPWLHQITPPLMFLATAYLAFRVVSRVLLVTGRDGPFRLILDAVKIHIPFMSKVVRSLATAKFARALGAMYASGVGAEHAMRVAGESCGNAWVQRHVWRVAPSLMQGVGFTQAMKETGQFPPIAIQMMATGEESGAIDVQLEKVAAFLETEAETAIRAAVKIMGVLVFLLMAIYIGSMVIGFYQGYGNEVEKYVNETG